MDHEIRAAGLAGNFCAVVLELDGVPDPERLAQHCREFARRFPRSVARLTRRGRQFAWRDEPGTELPFHHHRIAEPGSAPRHREQLLLDIVSRPAPALEAAPVELHLVEEIGTSALLLRWFHPLCDAKGAELILHHLFQPQENTAPQQQAAVEALLDKWSLWEKAQLAWKAIGNIRRLDKQASILPVTSQPSAPALGLKLVTLDQDQSARVMSQAISHTGMTGISLYFIGCLMRALEHTGSSADGDAYCVPYAMNLRKSKALYPLFGNQVSFLFAQAGRQLVRSREALFAHLREQNREAIRQRRDYAMLPLMQLGSWLTLDKHGRILRDSPHGRERSSAWFSYTGDMYPEPTQIDGCAVTGLYQLSPVTLPPALCLLASRCAGKVILSYNFIQGCFSDDWLEALTQAMTTELLGQATGP